MNKIALIIQREYSTRVKKKSFIVLSILGPILIAAFMIIPTWLAIQDDDQQLVEVIDETGLFINKLKNTKEIKFAYEFRSLGEAQKDLKNKGKYTAVLHIPEVVVTLPKTVQLFYEDEPKGSSVRYMENQIAKVIENKKLEDLYNLSLKQISGLRPPVKIVSNKLTTLSSSDDGKGEATFKKTAGGLASGVGFALAFFIYLFIFLFGVQVMRGVIEEKTNRIVEVIISSVKPFQLMMGKIIGIAMVAITQVLIWVVLSTAIFGGVQLYFKDELKQTATEEIKQEERFNPMAKGDMIAKSGANKGQTFIQGLNEKIQLINFPLVIACFLFYFIGGYLLYGSLFAAIGAAVDSEADTQQFMFPITMPLIISIAVAQIVLNNPDGDFAFWASIFPLTSPIIMMVRIPVGVAPMELILSMLTLTLTFIGSVWMAAKIYKTGILMYGKKVSFKELGKWLLHKS